MLKVGDKVPNFSAPLDNGNTFDMNDHEGKDVIIFFYPRDNTPTCTKEACNIRDNYEDLKKAGLTIMGVSTDSITSHQRFKNMHDLPFSLISDKDKTIVGLFGVRSKFGSAKRVTFWLGADGKIKHVWDQVKAVTHAQDILDIYKNQ
ncbi:MAG: peroxiredoxin [Candidatus Hodarchaeales archaeon]|jgi:peroxiredoxin Q/BCP